MLAALNMSAKESASGFTLQGNATVWSMQLLCCPAMLDNKLLFKLQAKYEQEDQFLLLSCQTDAHQLAIEQMLLA